MTTTPDIVAKLWGLCNVLRDDGVTYNEYVTELTYLLFLKMLEETGRENRLPENYRWGMLAKREGMEQLDYYKAMLLYLGKAKDTLVSAIFTDAQTRLRKPTNLKALTSNIDQLDWFSAREEGLGNLYEGLLEKNAADKKSGAGQYFTPRPLIDCIVRLMQPQPGETVQDPAAGTAGFLVAADRYIKDHTDDLYKLTPDQAHFQRNSAFAGAELVPDTHRLCMMNLLLHGIEGGVELIDTLSPDGEALPKADLILTNPPFGTKKGGGHRTESSLTDAGMSVSRQLPPETVLVSCIGNLGKIGYLAVDGACNQQINAILPSPVLLSRFTYYWAKTLKLWLEENSSATTVAIINKGRFSKAPISYPNLEEQTEVVRRIEIAFVWIDRLVTEATSARRLLDRLDQSVLAKAFRGELVPQDPEDEPASVLLDRIRAERGAVPKVKRGRKGKVPV